MGTNFSKEMKCHIMIREWSNTKALIESNEYEDDNECEKNFLLTLSGNLFVDKYRFHWISKYEKNNLLNNLTILNFDLNHLVKKKIKSFIKNESKNKKHYGETIWELLNFKKDNNIKKGINIKENNVFRIGKQIVKVIMLILEKDKEKIESKKNISRAQKNQIFSQNENNVFDIINNLPKKLEKELVCRICLDKETKINRFHNFCHCLKTMPTHLSCLQEWLKKNIIQNESNGITFYNFLNICCDICQEQFPSTYKNNKGYLIPLIKPKFPKGCSFIILELYLIENPSKIKALMIFDMSFERMIHVGRDEENDIIFKHTSISRNHCSFIIKKDGFYLFDKGSKFGSFLLFDNKKCLKKNNKYILKIKKNIIQIHPFKKKSCHCLKDIKNKNKKINKDPYRLDIKYLIDSQRRVQSMKEIKKENFIGSNKKNNRQKLTSVKNLDDFHNSIHENIKKSHNSEASEENEEEFDGNLSSLDKSKSIFGSILEKSKSFINNKSFLKKNGSFNEKGSILKKNESFRKDDFFDSDSFSCVFNDSENFEVSGQYAFN